MISTHAGVTMGSVPIHKDSCESNEEYEYESNFFIHLFITPLSLLREGREKDRTKGPMFVTGEYLICFIMSPGCLFFCVINILLHTILGYANVYTRGRHQSFFEVLWIDKKK